MDAASDLLVGNEGEEAFDLVAPGRARWCEVNMPAWSFCQPISNWLGLVRGVIVHHEVHVEVAGDAGFNLIEEFPELARTMLGVAAADDRAGRDVEGSEEGRRAVTGVVMSLPLDLARAHRQEWLASI